MKRRDFLKSLGMVAPVPLLLNNTPVNLLNSLSMFPVLEDCSAITDRVMVVLRLAGANDGLNSVIPIDQYDNYANLRPTLRIKESGTNAYIELDGTLPVADQMGLHPKLTGIKSLYDSGRLSLIHGVGYPSSNRSHFASENTMFAAKDGNTNAVLDDGWVGNYLNVAFPNSAENPSPEMPDPLAIQLGEKNPILTFHSKSAAKDTSYNLTAFQDDLLEIPNPASVVAPTGSEYEDTLSYIQEIESVMDAYYTRIFSVYTVGSNSAVTYPDTSMGNQLKIIARLIKGGSKTRVYMTNLGGFDNHANQIVDGSSHTGTHADLLTEFNDALVAFQTDIQNLGIDERVLTVSFSEFGRTVDENSNLGTDHGDLAPMFVIGKHINPGIIGSHPNLSNLGDDGRRYAEGERKFDYRQVYTTILQDWLGASDLALDTSPMKNFTSQKLDLITESQNADPDCLTESLLGDCSPADYSTTVIEAITTIDDWTYYAPSGYVGSEYLFAVEHTPTGEGANTAAIILEITIRNLLCGVNSRGYLLGNEGNEATYVPGQFVDINIVGPVQPDGFVNMRFYQYNDLFVNAEADASQFMIDNDVTTKSGMMWVKSILGFNPANDVREDGRGFNMQVLPMPETITGQDAGRDFFQWNGVGDFVGDTLIPLIRVTDEDGVVEYPANPEPGYMWFNPATGKLMGYDGVQWKELRRQN